MSLSGEDIYRWLIAESSGAPCEGFDKHIVCCALSVALIEVQAGRALVEALGLDPSELMELARTSVPQACELIARLEPSTQLTRAADEAALQELLFRGASERSRFQYLLSCIVARRALRPNHLWQDLGLRNRRELSWLMQRHFEPVAARNRTDMKWKKFLYRLICRDEGFGICSAPSCEACDDVTLCFGEESGESLLSQSRQTS